jgi:hypothetical protein
VLYNTVWSSAQLGAYESAGSRPVAPASPQSLRPDLLVPADLLGDGRLIRHDPRKLAAAIDALARGRGWW